MSGALAGLRVIDCSRLIAGGVLATVLADHGADVIKVENPRGGDPVRTWLRDRGELWWKVRLFETMDLTASPVYDIADITKDPHVVARGILVDVPDPDLGTVRMTAPTPRLGATPASIRWPGPPLGAHNREVYAELGIDATELERLTREGIV